MGSSAFFFFGQRFISLRGVLLLLRMEEENGLCLYNWQSWCIL